MNYRGAIKIRKMKNSARLKIHHKTSNLQNREEPKIQMKILHLAATKAR